MFCGERKKENKEQNGWPPCGQVRVIVVGDSGVGKTSLVHLIVKSSSVARPSQTIGCTVEVKAAKEARYDKEAVMKFFHMLIRRRYFLDELPAPSPWSNSSIQGTAERLDENFGDDDPFYKNTSLGGDPYKYNMLPSLPAQRNLTPPATLYPQQPASMSENYSFPRFSFSNLQEFSSSEVKTH